MTRNIWKYGRVLAIVIALTAMVTAGSADAKRGGVGKSVDGSEVEDGTLTGADVQDGSITGADVDESTLVCAEITGCTATGGGATAKDVTSAPAGAVAFTPGQTSYDGRLVTKTATSTCPAGKKPISAAYNWVGRDSSDPVFVVESFINGQNWVAVAGVDVSKDLQFNVVALCYG